MKVFIWADPYPVKWGNSMVFAVAETVEQAREIATANRTVMLYSTLADARPAAELGEPTRVLDVPCAEWHEWAE